MHIETIWASFVIYFGWFAFTLGIASLVALAMYVYLDRVEEKLPRSRRRLKPEIVTEYRKSA